MNILLQLTGYDYLLILCVFIFLIKQGLFRDITSNIVKLISANKMLIIILVLVFFLLLFFADYRFTMYFSENRSHTLEIIQTIGNTIGNGRFLYPMLATLVIIGVLFKTEKSKFFATCKISLVSCIYAGIFVVIIKSIVERERPFVSFNPYHFFDYSTAIATHNFMGFNYASFPSGHAIVCSSAIIVFAYAYRKNLIGKILWIYPIVVGIARVYSLNHWTSDVFSGIVFGIIIAIATYKANSKRLRLERLNG